MTSDARCSAGGAIALLCGCAATSSPCWRRTARRPRRSRSLPGCCSRSARSCWCSSCWRAWLAIRGSPRDTRRCWRRNARSSSVGLVFPVGHAHRAAGLRRVADARAASATTGRTRMRIEVTGEQWWWRVVYAGAAGAIASANEIRIPGRAAGRVHAEGRRRDPQLLGAEPRRQGRHDSRPHHAPAADGRARRCLSRPMRGILRRPACADGARGHRHAARPSTTPGLRAKPRRRQRPQPRSSGAASRSSSPPAAAPATPCAARRPPARSVPT